MKERLMRLLQQRKKQYIPEAGRVPSAVLLPVYMRDGHHHIIFIKRTENVTEHKGQISFPGGSREALDVSLLDTALRESHEEIGLDAGDVEVLGELDDEVTTTSNFVVTPFVGILPWPYRFIRNEIEVEEIIDVPIPALLAQGCLRPDTEELNGETVASFTYQYEGRRIWGATARILNKFLEIYVRAIDETGG